MIHTVCTTVSDSAGELVTAPFAYLAASAGAAAKWMFQGVWGVFDATTLVDVTRPGFIAVYNVLFGVAVFVMLLFFCLQLITGLIRRDPSALTRAATGLGKSVLGSFLVVTLTGLALTVTDQLSVGIVQATGTTMDRLGSRIATLGAGIATVNVTSAGGGAIVTIFLAGLAIAATGLLWFSLLIRKSLLLVAIVLAPIALAGAVWDATRGWVSKWASAVVALIVSKLVIVIVFLVATAQLASPIGFDLHSISEPVAGIVLMFIAAFAPYMCYRFISFMGIDVYHAVTAEQEAKQALNRPVPLPTKPLTSNIQSILGSNGSGRRGGATPAATTPPTAAGAGGGAGSSGAGAAAAAGSGTTAGAAAGPVGAAVGVAAPAVAGPATAGPRLGATIGNTANQQGEQPATTSPHVQSPPPRRASGRPEGRR